MGWMMGWWLLVMLSGLLVVVGIILLLVWAGMRFWKPTTSDRPPAPEDPLTILQRRYARGEIKAEEYERIRADLERSR